MKAWIPLLIVLSVLIGLYLILLLGCLSFRSIRRRHLKLVFNETLRVAQSFPHPLVASYGTLLGTVREERIIPHDHDVDFHYDGAYLRELVDHFEKNVNRNKFVFERLGGGFCRLHSKFLYKTNLGKRMAHLDIYDGHKLPNGNWRIIDLEFPEKAAFGKSRFGTSKDANYPVPIPEKAEKFLEIAYGKSWKTPIYLMDEHGDKTKHAKLLRSLKKIGLYI
jgi:hypothetical protein